MLIFISFDLISQPQSNPPHPSRTKISIAQLALRYTISWLSISVYLCIHVIQVQLRGRGRRPAGRSAKRSSNRWYLPAQSALWGKRRGGGVTAQCPRNYRRRVSPPTRRRPIVVICNNIKLYICMYVWTTILLQSVTDLNIIDESCGAPLWRRRLVTGKVKQRYFES